MSDAVHRSTNPIADWLSVARGWLTILLAAPQHF